MRIGILTYHYPPNFGANLQALSTFKYLENKGHQPIIINWQPEDLLSGHYAKVVSKEQKEVHDKFVDDHLTLTKLCRTDEEIRSVIKEESIEAIIVGSDAILQHVSFLGKLRFSKKSFLQLEKVYSDRIFPNPFWLSFINDDVNVKTALMSASSQNAQYYFFTSKYKKLMRKQLDKFSFIGTRDNWTRKMVKNITNGKIDPTITPDPVFGFNHNVNNTVSKSEIIEKFKLNEKYILISFYSKSIDKEWAQSFEKIANSHGYMCVEFPHPEGLKFGLDLKTQINTPLDPLDWYNLIKFSSGYVGQRMHPMIVAMHNSVPFYSFDNYGIKYIKVIKNYKSSKIFDLLNRSGFLNNWFSQIKSNQSAPSPISVFENINNFDRQKCSDFVAEYHKRYLVMMEGILSKFS